jgi:hypothetical protein
MAASAVLATHKKRKRSGSGDFREPRSLGVIRGAKRSRVDFRGDRRTRTWRGKKGRLWTASAHPGKSGAIRLSEQAGRSGWLKTRSAHSGKPGAITLSEQAGLSGITLSEQAGLSAPESSRPLTNAVDIGLESLAALLRSPSPEPGTWMETARVLNRVAVDIYRSDPRAATLALALSDALTFTPPAELESKDLRPLFDGLRLLRAPFISGEAEERVFQSLLDHGWTVTADFEEPDVEQIRS